MENFIYKYFDNPDGLNHARTDLIYLDKKLAEFGFTLQDLLDRFKSDKYFEDEFVLVQRQRDKRLNGSYCPECGSILLVIEVNTNKRNKVGENYETLIQCKNIKNCDYEIYSKKDLRTTIAELKSGDFKENQDG